MDTGLRTIKPIAAGTLPTYPTGRLAINTFMRSSLYLYRMSD